MKIFALPIVWTTLLSTSFFLPSHVAGGNLKGASLRDLESRDLEQTSRNLELKANGQICSSDTDCESGICKLNCNKKTRTCRGRRNAEGDCCQTQKDCKNGLWCLPGIDAAGQVDFATSKCIHPYDLFTKMCARYRNEGLIDSPIIDTSGMSEGDDTLGVCDGGVCEVCDSLDSLQQETEQCAARLGEVSDLLGKVVDRLDQSHQIASTSSNIVVGINTLNDVFTTIQPVTQGIPYVGPLLKAFNKATAALKGPLKFVGDQKQKLAEAKDTIQQQQDRVDEAETALQNAVCAVDISRKTVDTVKDVTCSACVQTYSSYDSFSEDIEPVLGGFASGFDALGAPMRLCNADFPKLDLPDVQVNMTVLEEIEKVVKETVKFFNEVKDKVVADANLFSCCEDVGIAIRTMGDFFSDLASLVTCAADGATAGVIKESLDLLLPAFNGVLADVNRPINDYNALVDQLNSALFEPAIVPKIKPSSNPIVNVTGCSVSIASIDAELTSICSGAVDCGLPHIEPLSFGDTDGQFNPEAILQEIAAQCTDSWENIKDMEVDDCCPAARERLGIPREGLSNGASCLEWGRCNSFGKQCIFWGMCKSDLCFNGICTEPGRNWEQCSTWRPCKGKEGYNCLVGSNRCANGQLEAPCSEHSHCKKSSFWNCGRRADNKRMCIAGIEGDYCFDKCQSGFQCDPVGNNQKRCLAIGSIGSSCSSNARCDSGYCGWNGSGLQVCSTGNNGEICTLPNQCKSGYCAGKVCTAKKGLGSTCGANHQCSSGYCGKNSNSQRVCTTGNDEQYCGANNQCKSGYCAWDGKGNQLCTTLRGLGSTCGGNYQCSSGFCGWNGSNQQVCTTGNDGQYCSANNQCKSSFCPYQGLGVKRTCITPKANGVSCSGNNQCSSGYCGWNGSSQRVCTTGNDGQYCSENNQCKSNYCPASSLLFGKRQCASKKANGAGCSSANQCNSGYCGWNCRGTRVCTSGGQGNCCSHDNQCIKYCSWNKCT